MCNQYLEDSNAFSFPDLDMEDTRSSGSVGGTRSGGSSQIHDYVFTVSVPPNKNK